MGSYWFRKAVCWFITPISWSRSYAFQWPEQPVPGKQYTPEEEPKPDQSVIVQLRPDVFLQTHPLLIAPILFRKKIMTTLDKIFHSLQNYRWPDSAAGYTKDPDKWAFCIYRKLATGPVQAERVRLIAQAQMKHLGSPAHLPIADSLQLCLEGKHNWSDTAWAHQAFCMCITGFSGESQGKHLL